MIFSGSLVTIKEGCLEKIKNYLTKFPQLEVYTVSDDETNIVVAIEEENDEQLEKLCSEISEHEDILGISHHYFHFEEEVEAIKNNEKKVNLKGFSKKRNKTS